MAAPKFNYELAARVLVDAIALGDRTASDRHKISEKTVGRYRARMREDHELAELVRQKGREAEHGWHFARARFLRRTLEKLDKLVEQAGVDQFENIIEALKAAGELELATEALGVGSSNHQPGPSAPEAAGGSDRAEGDGGTGPGAEG